MTVSPVPSVSLPRERVPLPEGLTRLSDGALRVDGVDGTAVINPAAGSQAGGVSVETGLRVLQALGGTYLPTAAPAAPAALSQPSPQDAAPLIAATEALWGGGDIRDLDEATLAAATAGLPRAALTVGESTVADALVALGFEKGKTAARRTISSGGASINNVKVEDPEAILREEDVLAGGLALIRKGRKNLAVLELS